MRKEYDFDKIAGRETPHMSMVFRKTTDGCSIVTELLSTMWWHLTANC